MEAYRVPLNIIDIGIALEALMNVIIYLKYTYTLFF